MKLSSIILQLKAPLEQMLSTFEYIVLIIPLSRFTLSIHLNAGLRLYSINTFTIDLLQKISEYFFYYCQHQRRCLPLAPTSLNLPF